MTVPLCQAEPGSQELCMRLTDDMPEVECPCMTIENTAQSREGDLWSDAEWLAERSDLSEEEALAFIESIAHRARLGDGR